MLKRFRTEKNSTKEVKVLLNDLTFIKIIKLSTLPRQNFVLWK